MASADVSEVLPKPLDSSSSQPPLFDGTTRLYTSYPCPYAQRVWIARDYKGLQEKIELVPLNLQDRPAWYKEKVYPVNKVPALEHNGKVIGESIDLLKYIDSNFEGPKLFPEDPAKKQFGEELLSYTDKINQDVFTAFKGDPVKESATSFDYLENALHKFEDGPFFLGQFSLVDVAYITFVERFDILLKNVWNYDFTSGRPKLAAWFEEINKIDVYKPTKVDPKEFLAIYANKVKLM
ncbi:glutathione S-transferase L3-like [Tripterygium wilfordii]|uniref:glutathione S-transferase L3-like n=1 Tax=Tripterygium wilfordii TaxID=458696 RepID=UPI0018F7E5C3|nr:glutathione S-transferase L3-like [Tripterygium wilfordii]